ncbi:MAG: YesL family protein [Clostridia bacterium]|nr:YesL family protein [Clostridia bacterium]
MFGRMMNNFYYGKSGKGDYRKEDLPKNRWQLFWEMLRVRLSSLCRLNLMTIVAWLPLLIVLINFISTIFNVMMVTTEYHHYLTSGTVTETFTQEMANNLAAQGIVDEASISGFTVSVFFQSINSSLLWMIPAILITGPIQAGLAYVTRNWSRDEHAFIWSDFKDAVKGNWKQGLGISAISSVMPILLYTCFTFYGDMAAQNLLFMVPQMLIIILGAVWYLGCTFMYPLMVSYEVKFKTLVKNGLMLAIARLPHTVGIRLAALIPALLCAVIFWFTGTIYALLALLAYYVMIGFSMSRFIFASYTNGIFDKYINSRIEGAKINRGIATEEDEDDDDEEDQPQDGANLEA